MQPQALQFACRHWSVAPHHLSLSVDPLSGGLESAVARATVRAAGVESGHWPARFVIKELRGHQRREAVIYRELWSRFEAPPAVQVLGADAAGDAHYLYLEHVAASPAWPWADAAPAAAVCRALARLHDAPLLPLDGLDWDYEGELERSAADTVKLAEAARDASGRRYWRRVGDLRRVVAALPDLRRRLLERGGRLIHGDMHPGNVIINGENGSSRIVLIDWARARIGSPLEDVASWLHSLGCWEPEARRCHDALLRSYLLARGEPPALTPELRRLYWYASASNGMSGAIRYHLAVLADVAASEHQRSHSWRALPAWTRVIRQVAALLATTRGG